MPHTLWILLTAARALQFEPLPFGGGQPPPADLVRPAALSRFITQRAIQQQLYYCEMNHDETTGDFLAEFLRPLDGLDETGSRTFSPLNADYHGYDALPTASSRDFLCEMLASPDFEVTVKKPMGCSGGGGSGGLNSFTGEPINRQKNPFVKTRYFTYTVDLRPGAIAERLFEMRVQVAAEVAEDLVLLREEGAALERQRAKLLFTEGDDSERAAAARRAVERALPVFDDTRFSDKSGTRSSPFRGATYDLVKQLATAAAVEQLLDENKNSASHRFLETKWATSKPTFQGHRRWTRGDPSAPRAPADELLFALCNAPPSFVDGRLVDPLGVAAEITERRVQLATPWAEALAQVPGEHLAWRRWHLSRYFKVGGGAAAAAGDSEER